MKILIPMAGLGSRFRVSNYDTPKPLIVVNGKTLIEHSINSLNIEGDFIFVTRKFDSPEHNETLSKILKSLKPNSIEICINSPTRGAVETCLFARSQINTDEELLITNCDQILNWNSEYYMQQSRRDGIDGSILLYDSDDPKNSFARIGQDGFIAEIVEKQPISNDALVGLHYWKHGKDFVQSAEVLVNSFVVTGKKECYVSETYNNMINDGKRIIGVKIPTNGYIPLGTPKDLSLYLGKLKEFYTEKPKTIFCDIDGTILKHAHYFSDLKDKDPIALDGVLGKINEWDSQGHKIILCTARKESARKMTEKHLNRLGLCWDILLMGMTSGKRILINDKLNPQDKDRANAVNVITDAGFNSVDWSKYDL